MDTVAVISIVAVVLTIAVMGFIAYKVIKLMEQGDGSHDEN